MADDPVGPAPVGAPLRGDAVATYTPALRLADGSVGRPEVYHLRQTVWAIPIEDVKPEPHGGVTLVLCDGFAPHVIPSPLVVNYMPVAGDMLVILADGSQVIRDKARFDAEYEAWRDAPEPTTGELVPERRNKPRGKSAEPEC